MGGHMEESLLGLLMAVGFVCVLIAMFAEDL